MQSFFATTPLLRGRPPAGVLLLAIGCGLAACGGRSSLATGGAERGSGGSSPEAATGGQSAGGQSAGGTIGAGGDGAFGNAPGSGASGGTAAGGSGVGGNTPGPQEFFVGGVATGLHTAGLMLLESSGQNLSVDSDGAFRFAEPLPDGSGYEVSISAQPAGQLCQLFGFAGTIEGASVDDVRVHCEDTLAIEEFSVSTRVVDAGETVLLTAVTRGADSCTLVPLQFSFDPNGLSTHPFTVHTPTTFTLTCQADGRSVERSLSVVVTDSDWRQVAVGSHSCAIKSEGGLFCWGENGEGQLGDGTHVSRGAPTAEASAARDWEQVAVGGFQSCAIKTDGRLYCWGLNHFGQLGTGDTQSSSAPVQEASAASDWAQVSVGSEHSCAIKSDGRLYCWGYQAYGRLGNGSTSFSHEPLPVQESSASPDWAQVSAGWVHTCAIKQDGTLWCWGDGGAGRLGSLGAGPISEPTQESTQASDWAQVAAGVSHTCATKTDGRLYCWGSGNQGKLGNGDEGGGYLPRQEASASSDWVEVAVSSYGTCGRKTGGEVFCWGNNYSQFSSYGPAELLVPTRESSAAKDWIAIATGVQTCGIKVDGRLVCWGGSDSSSHPVQEATLSTNWAQVDNSGFHTCGTRTDGRLFCWGNGYDGQLGQPGWLRQIHGAPLEVGEGGWFHVGCGVGHSCATKRDGTLSCWGGGGAGELGQDSNDASLVPLQEVTGSTSWQSVEAGTSFSCGFTQEGQIVCWGRGVEGQLGMGETPWSVATPDRPVSGGNHWTQLTVGSEHACALTQGGQIFCWGEGAGGRLGTGDSRQQAEPTVEVSGGSTWVDVSAGARHTCAIDRLRRLFCWGSGEAGQLGNDQTSDHPLAVQEATGARDWLAVSAGGSHTCALKLDGSLYCWGSGGLGELGSDAMNGSVRPVQESSYATNWKEVLAGWGMSCGVKEDGRLFCWGYDFFGQLGQGKDLRRTWPAGPLTD